VKLPLIELDNVYAKTDRGEDIFLGLKLIVQAGRSAVIVGGPGSGKTILVDLLLGRRFPTSGTVEMFSDMVRPRASVLKKIRRKIGGVGGHFGLIEGLTVSENIILPMVLTGERESIQKERLTKLLGEFSLLNLAGQRPSSLTRVERTLVQIARASIASQPLMIIDEPSAGLDQKTYLRVLDYLVKASLAGRSLLILASERPPVKLPKSDIYEISKGVLV
jgi:putative ABC transport system ATP-binding protein